jgi:hypothetical protein
VLVCLAALGEPASGQDTTLAKTKTAHITYLTSVTAYLDAGKLDGLVQGARLEVVRRGAGIGVLQVAFLASHQASCDIVRTTAALAVGDSVRYAPVAVRRDSVASAPAPTPAAAARAAREAPSQPSGPRLRGRVGVEYFLMEEREGMTGRVSQPALDLRLDGPPLGASYLNLDVDVRARRTYTILPDGSAVAEGLNRIYQASLSAQAPGSPARLTVGRQISGDLAPLGLFDGALAEVVERDWSTGVMTGSEPDPIQLAFLSSNVELGGYVQRHSPPGALTHWAVTLGASGSYENSHSNREFAFVQGSYLSTKLSTFVTQEVDYYRAWKLLPGMQMISPTSTFAIVQYRATSSVTLDAGYDDRRNVRLYRDIVNPETTFDDTYRQGAWAGTWFQLNGRLRVGFDARQSSGGPAGSATSYTGSLSAERLTRYAITLRTRSTYYTTSQLHGVLQSVAAGFMPGDRLHLELNGGARLEHNPFATPASETVTWQGLDLDLTLARAWYVMISATHQRGGLDGYDQAYAGLSLRF